MRRFFGIKGSVSIFHFDYDDDDSSVKIIYNMALAQGGGWMWDYAYGSYNGGNSYDTTATTGITGYPFTEARYFSPLLGASGSYATINNNTASPAPHRLDVIHPAVEAWIKPDTWNQDAVIAQFCPRVSTTKGGYGMRLDSSGNLVFFITKAGGSEESATYDVSGLSLSEYHYFAGLYDGTNIMLFVNGDLVETSAVVSSGDLTYSLGGTEDGQIGHRNNDATSIREYIFTGNIASVRFSYSLTPWEIYNVYNSVNDLTEGFTNAAGTTNLYELNDSDQQTSDPVVDSVGGMNGILANGVGNSPYRVAGPIGGTTEDTRCCLRLNTNDVQAEITDAAIDAAASAMNDPSKDWTIELLFYADAIAPLMNEDGYLVSKGKRGTNPEPLALWYDDIDELIRVYLNEIDGSQTIQATSRVYHKADRMMYVVATWDASEKKADLYFNGIHVASDTNALFDPSNCYSSYPFRLGASEYVSSVTPIKHMQIQLHCLRFSETIISVEDMVKFITGLNPKENN